LTITDYLTGSKLIAENLATTSERFDFIAADSRLTTNLDEGSFIELLNSLPKSYDLIVLDVAPSLTQSLKLALAVADHIFAPIDSSLHSLRALLQLRAMTGIPVTAVATGEIALAEVEPVLDVALIRANEVDGYSQGALSVLTVAKESEVAESYRSATYSILEILGLE
jgi:cellulose biosynthesis protein BcsQ